MCTTNKYEVRIRTFSQPVPGFLRHKPLELLFELGIVKGHKKFWGIPWGSPVSTDLRGGPIRKREILHFFRLRVDINNLLLNLLGVGPGTKPPGEGKYPKVTLNLNHG